jgi:hypothetical protein
MKVNGEQNIFVHVSLAQSVVLPETGLQHIAK